MCTWAIGVQQLNSASFSFKLGMRGINSRAAAARSAPTASLPLADSNTSEPDTPHDKASVPVGLLQDSRPQGLAYQA